MFSLPTNVGMYPDGFETTIKAGPWPNVGVVILGGHFDGVLTVVAKLFAVVQPDQAYFGEKDYQQYLLIKRMAQDLNLPTEVVGCPIYRNLTAGDVFANSI